MTQKQMEDKIREIKFVYGERAQELVKMHKPAVDEVEQKIEEAKINRDKELMTFHERLNKLNDQEYELRRMGHNALSPELDECRRKKNALKQENQQAHIQWCNTMHALKIEQQKAKTVMQKELDTNATMRRKALNELQKEYNGTNHRLD